MQNMETVPVQGLITRSFLETTTMMINKVERLLKVSNADKTYRNVIYRCHAAAMASMTCRTCTYNRRHAHQNSSDPGTHVPF